MELHDLSDVLTATGPFVTVHVECESTIEQAQDKDDLTWRGILQELAGRGVEAPVLAALEAARGGHADGSSRLVVATTADATARLSAPLAAPARRQVVEDYAQERGQAKRAADGVEDVVAALQKAQVQTLLVTTDAAASSTLLFGPDPTQLGTTAADLAALGVDDPQEGPMVDVLLRAALGTGADVQLVPHELTTAPRGGVGAVLRYADSPGSAAAAQ